MVVAFGIRNSRQTKGAKCNILTVGQVGRADEVIE